jgi:hypothetical protein
MQYNFSEDMRNLISAMVESHRGNPDRFIVIRSDAGINLMHADLDIEPIATDLYDRLVADGFVDAQRSTLELTQRAYDAYDSGFNLELEGSPPEVEHFDPEVDPEDLANLADAPVDHPALAEALERLAIALDDPDVLATPILSRLADVFGILADHPEYLNRTSEYILDALAVLGVLREEEPAQ